ncbi:uncharacterized protein LOC107808027 isoform X1 [Nicotiana tabacum]|uniref:Uncharacterized protein LOC107808027 isoform X1 n=6 Tax=Nicotiana TaxID=4085 RepID=A0A1S4BGJ7_TOBAC|nr:PREDICTED: uncharacterized protein LOC104235536 isoform X1 [Nicotiana sylvestris]XP_016487993.1 PREDICTED: uncharacterized protein LOC107808027 [Nicotiana tabacum]
MQKRVLKVSWRRDFQLSAKGMKRQAGRVKDSGNLAEHKEKNKEKGFVNNKMDGQAFRGEHKIGANAIPPSLSTMAKANLMESPDHLKKMLRRQGRKNRNLKKDVMTNQERKTRIKIGKRKVMESKKTRKKRRKRKRRRRTKVNTRKARRINQETSIRMTLLVLITINFHLYPRKTLLVRSTWEFSERGRMLKLMVSCMRVNSGLLNCCGRHPLCSRHRMEKNLTLTQKQTCSPPVNSKLLLILKWKTRSTR